MADYPVLTVAERAVLSLSGEVFSLFKELGDHHPADVEETARDIHNIQNRIMARVVMRTWARCSEIDTGESK
jgi:hypothetical protein